MQEKRRPGRPKKVRRGRPPKNAVKNTDEYLKKKVDAFLKKKPGRPKKIKPGRPKKINEKTMKVEAIASDPNVIVINGQKFYLDRVTTKKIDKVEHADRIIFKPLKENQMKQDLDLVIKTLSEKTSAEEIIKEIMKEVPAKTIRRIAKRIRDKKPIKKQHGCLGFKVGDSYVSLVG